MKNLFSSKKFITTIMVSVGLGFTSSSYALSLQNIYDVPGTRNNGIDCIRYCGSARFALT